MEASQYLALIDKRDQLEKGRIEAVINDHHTVTKICIQLSNTIEELKTDKQYGILKYVFR